MISGINSEEDSKPFRFYYLDSCGRAIRFAHGLFFHYHYHLNYGKFIGEK